MKQEEREGVVTLKGKPVTLLGTGLKAGDRAPDFRTVNADFEPVALSDFKGTVCLISAVPSLDTPVCAAQTKRFNEEVGNLPDNVHVLAISMDLPFAQKRFCDSEKAGRIEVLSDHVWRDFGVQYGVIVKNMGLLARSVFVIDGDGDIVYQQIVPEVTEHPDYDAALDAVREAS